jgi:hypothetical protein
MIEMDTAKMEDLYQLFEAYRQAFPDQDAQYEYVLELFRDGSGTITGIPRHDGERDTIIQFDYPHQALTEIECYLEHQKELTQ